MSDFLDALNIILTGLKYPIELYGFVFSLWNVILFTIICSVAIAFIKKLFE